MTPQTKLMSGVQAVTDPLTGGIGFLSANGETVTAPFINASKPFVMRPVGNFTGHATTGSVTQCAAFSIPFQYDAIEIGYIHNGGFGAATGVIGCIAASDDIGTADYTDPALATFRKFVTPLRATVEYNSVTANGWHALTWGGAASTGAADAGASKITVTWSDVDFVESIEDISNPGYYPLLVRLYQGAGPYTTAELGTGSCTAHNYSDLTAQRLVQCLRSGDNVTNPATFTTASTPAVSTGATPPIIIRAWAKGAFRLFMFVGDSRFDTVTEAPYNLTQGFRGLPFMLRELYAAEGKKYGVIRNGQPGATSSRFTDQAIKTMETCQPKVVFILGYSVNDSNATSTVISMSRANLLRNINACVAIGALPVIVPAFPATSWNATYLANVQAFNAWCKTLGYPVLDALANYGDAGGVWLAGYDATGGHGTQALYAQLAADLKVLVGSNL